MRRLTGFRGGLLLSLCLSSACAPVPYAVEPQNPGDHCLDGCPEGLTCEGPPYVKGGDRRRPGTCRLLPGRCATSADCQPTGQCVRTSNQLGLCAP